MYQRIGATAFKKDLTNIIKLCDAIGNPQNSFKSIHVAGTNGKGSTCHILSAIYQNNGYKVGLYTSPHLLDFRERIKCNGEMCSKEFVVAFIERIKPHISLIEPSFFEITVAMAFAYFAAQKVDIAIIETGLGGRLDSTNIINPICTAITSIDFDHMDMLGNTLAKIAGEKAGIIKHKTPVVLGYLPEEALSVIEAKASHEAASIHHAYHSLFETDLRGDFQQRNINTAMTIVHVCQATLPASKDKALDAVKHVSELSGFVGRMQVFNDSPRVIADVSHNEQGIRESLKELRKHKLNVYFILGFVKDKDLHKIIAHFPTRENYAFVKPKIARGKPSLEVANDFAKHGIEGNAFDSLQDAVTTCFREILENKQDDKAMIYIGGSNFIVADFLHLKHNNKLPF
jgi:dihydrofolate synthase/folylpolyglutamate synthase